MSLSAFINEHHEEIIQEFAAFAHTLMPPGTVMSEAELRDHAEEILTAITHDMGGDQTVDEQARKSRGLGTVRGLLASGQLHADDRILHGFSLRAVLAEFRALRATVLRFYELSGASDLAEVRRFNEAIDESLTESIARFALQTESFRDQFVGILSHDLRDPLGAITTGAALLAVPEDNPERRGRVASRILSSAQRMQRMIADLLDLTQTRLGSGIRVVRGPTNLDQVCEDVMLEVQDAYPDAVFRWEKSGSLVGEWDSDRLSQVVSNLVRNAVQHGGGTPVTLSARGENDTVVLLVHNGGIPIAPDTMPFVFEPLVRGPDKGVKRSHNIGLGLFIARAIVCAHGGRIEVNSSSTLGTTFTVLLPRSSISNTVSDV
jgi:signal transduction histidine kinase